MCHLRPQAGDRYREHALAERHRLLSVVENDTEFEILAACLFNQNGRWEFLFIPTDKLQRRPEYPDYLTIMQPVPPSAPIQVSGGAARPAPGYTARGARGAGARAPRRDGPPVRSETRQHPRQTHDATLARQLARPRSNPAVSLLRLTTIRRIFLLTAKR